MKIIEAVAVESEHDKEGFCRVDEYPLLHVVKCGVTVGDLWRTGRVRVTVEWLEDEPAKQTFENEDKYHVPHIPGMKWIGHNGEAY